MGSGRQDRPPNVPLGWWWLLLVLLLFRAAFLTFSVPAGAPLTGDETIYDQVARNLLDGRGYEYKGKPWVFRPPGWPAALAAIYAVAGDERRTVVLWQGLFDCITVLVGVWLAVRIERRREVFVPAALLIALWPPYLRESRFLQTEPLFTACVALVLLAFVRFWEMPARGRALALGAVSGVATLVRPTGLIPLAGLLLGWILCASPGRRLAPLSAVALGLMLIVAPWTIRNAAVFKTFIPVSTGGGEQFYLGTVPETEGRYVQAVWRSLSGRVLDQERERLGREPSPRDRDQAFLEAGIENWKSDPGGNLERFGRRVGRLCFVPLGNERPLLRWGFLLTLLGLYALALRRARVAWRERGTAEALPAAFMIAVLVYVLASAMFYTNSRYFEPVRLIVLVLAAAEVSRLLVAQRKRFARLLGQRPSPHLPRGAHV